MIVIVKFKSWRDAYLFLLNHANFSCLNCKYGGHNLDLSVDHTDSEYVHLFCKDAIAMVRLDYSFVCSKWVHEDNDKTALDTVDCYSWDLPDEVIEIIEKNDKKWGIDELEELIHEYG